MLIHLEKLGKSFGEKIVLHDVTASVEREDRIGIVGQNGAGKTTLLKILTGEYQDYEGEFSVTHGVTLGYLEQNAKLDATLDLYGEMRSTFAPVLDAMAQMQVLERKMAAQPDDTELLARHDQLQNIVDAADGYNMDVNIKKVLSGMGFAQDTWQKNIAVLSGGELTRLRLAKLLLEKPDVLILDEPTNHLDFATMEWLENYLKSYSGAVLVVSHDRYFLDNVCTKIWEVSFQTMTTYKGNFSAYLPRRKPPMPCARSSTMQMWHWPKSCRTTWTATLCAPPPPKWPRAAASSWKSWRSPKRQRTRPTSSSSGLNMT